MPWLISAPSSPSYLSVRLHNNTFFSARVFSERSRGLLIYRRNQHKSNSKNCAYYTVKCQIARVNEGSSSSPVTLINEPHKYFDQAIITVRAGDGGHGAILNMPNQRAGKSQGKHEKEKTRRKSLYKRDFDGSLILPMGGHGGDVVIYADEGKDTLLEFHKKGRYNAKRGGNVDAMGVLTSQLHNGLAAPTLRIPVPVGTVVKRKRGKLLADLAHPGDEVLVARGGQGGISLVEMPEHRRKKLMALTTNVMRDDSDKGLPNAGKSTLLAAITLAKPDIADYPFTTLMPNLGRLDGDPSLGARMYSSEATLADLPGLIEGAHLGKGLGRNFLRHLRRTRLLVHVVDAAADNPVNDYRTVKEELRMYNPDYLERPFIVVLNKIDLPEARDRLSSLTEKIMRIGSDGASSKPETSSDNVLQLLASEAPHADVSSPGIQSKDEKDKEIEDYPRPLAVVGVSVLKGIRINEMLKEIRAALKKCRDPDEALKLGARS
ncbi:probable GTP-binding protein OBGC2 isoform X2 [Juglans microcarpa x Juglans regia]|uniref:probable GTP-binding protein OBGC2 isoform X2 n=1 Tax=Juglans microcarpa x Juglans regia TaxID=2249226 RepID=UPI001B7F043C|nr:probable GTP-binding protein OBGC2 isoform X2 [Juglans microcarpa x Juglans regia]